ncbi:restriction endonuclease subunit S, partial [Psittacicella hinzii]|uniref:restriction endonuclease subunit S n=1 Tax=Psittacicella hinzii TaxID=2028575 RepID=UPI0036126CDA
EAELHNKQYWEALYKLMSSIDKANTQPLISVCDIFNKARKPIAATKRIKGNTPYYGANGIVDYVDGFTHDGHYVSLAEDGAPSLQPYSILRISGKFWANNHIHLIKPKEGVMDFNFLYHYLRSLDFTPLVNNPLSRSKLTTSSLKLIPIPVIPLEEQKRIAHILDTMLELKEAVEREVELRRKQFEYYKYWLLNPDGKLETM